MTRHALKKKKKRNRKNRKAEKEIKIPWNWKMRGRRTVCFITLKVREVATYISRIPARARSTTREKGERGEEEKTKRPIPPSRKKVSPLPSLKTSAFESDEWREPGSLANCEQAKCSSGFAALATLWMRESTMRSNSGKRGVVYEWQDLIYIYEN